MPRHAYIFAPLLSTAGALALLASPTGATAKSGKDPTLKFTAEPVANVAGGRATGAAYAQQIELNLEPDLGKVTGVGGLSFHATFVNRLGENVSTRFVGDPLFQSQAVYGGTQHAAIHLVQAYLEEQAGKLDAAAGRLPVGEGFATSPLYCQFMNTAICGYPHSLAAKAGFITFPNSTWGARLRVSPSSALSIEGGAYQVRPKLGGKYGFDWGWSGTTGVYFPAEVEWKPSFGTSDLQGHYKAGFGYDTSDYADNYYDAAGRPFVLSGAPARRRPSRHSFYLLADQMLARHGKGDGNGLVLMAGYVHSEPGNSQIANFGFAGLVDEGPIAGRPDDKAGLVVSYADISDTLVAAQRLQSARGLPLSGGANGLQSHELIVEANYEVKLDKHFSVTPDVQYVVHPGASSRYPNALLVGGRITAQF